MNVIHSDRVPWPAGRAVSKSRKNGPFTTNMTDACGRIEKEVGAFTKPGKGWRTRQLSIFADGELSVRSRFLTRSRGIRDPRVAVTFDLDGLEYNIVADRYIEPWQNLCGIAKYIEAIRAQERNGIFTAQEMMASFAALPAPTPTRPWFKVLEIAESSPLEVIEAVYRQFAKKLHPDVPGGSTEAFQELQSAYEAGKAARQ